MYLFHIIYDHFHDEVIGMGMDEKYLKQMTAVIKEKRRVYGYTQEKMAELLDKLIFLKNKKR